MSEELIVRHCSPTLAAIKTGSLFNCAYTSKKDLKLHIRQLNRRLVPKGICVIPLRFSNDRSLIYVYRPKKLRQDLFHNKALALLSARGYISTNAHSSVAQLSKRLCDKAEFPHEIGLFLGYPPEDVYGFIENKASCAKCVGCWKVYSDVAAAEKIFTKYKKCTKIYYAQWAKGKSIERLTVAD